MSDTLGNIALVALGWLLGVLSQSIERRTQKRLERRRILTRLSRILTSISLSLKLSNAAKEVGFIQTLEGMFDLDESWTKNIPAPPPSLPQDYDRVMDELVDWEARQGKYDLYNRLLNLKGLIEGAHQIYSGIEAAARDKLDLPDRPLGIYRIHIEKIEESVAGLSDTVRDARRGRLNQFARRMRKKASVFQEIGERQHDRH